MLIKVDAQQLEWRVKVWMAQDTVGIAELQRNEDLHTDNQKFFKLPSRLIAKIYIYRQIFADAFGDKGMRGPAFAYANDPDFMGTSTSVKYWTEVSERFFDKYKGVHKHSIELIREATSTGKIVNPSGRFYDYAPYEKWNGQMDWPRTDILNWPVQGLSADFMALARKEAWQRLREFKEFGDTLLFINTVHDDIELDVANDPELVYNSSTELIKSFELMPHNFEKTYGVHVNTPMGAEVKFGMSLLESDMMKFKPATFEEDWKKLIDVYKNNRSS